MIPARHLLLGGDWHIGGSPARSRLDRALVIAHGSNQRGVLQGRVVLHDALVGAHQPASLIHMSLWLENLLVLVDPISRP